VCSDRLKCYMYVKTVPSAVLDVQWKVLNSSTVRVSWKEPQHTNGMIKQYEISFVRGFVGTPEGVRSVTVSNSKLSTEVSMQYAVGSTHSKSVRKFCLPDCVVM
jgi:hypothetical protein